MELTKIGNLNKCVHFSWPVQDKKQSIPSGKKVMFLWKFSMENVHTNVTFFHDGFPKLETNTD